jgi:gamma-glutamyltranspeptidase/glutathione hydrolase
MEHFDFSLPHARRAPLLARNVVATSQPLAAQAGLQALARGGNAVDAALAAAIALTVLEPTMNGIGGDAFALVWDGRRLHGLNASGRAPRAWNPSRFAGLERMPVNGWDSVTVPGAVSAWAALSERFGALPFEDLFEAAIRYARDGFNVSPVIARQWQDQAAQLYAQPGFAQAWMPAGRAPQAGERWRFEAQADTLAEIASSRGESFYRGRLAQRIAAFARATGGAIDQNDLAQHRADWVEPIANDYHGFTVHEIPPNGQGIAALMALGILEHLPVGDTRPDSAQRLHLQIEAMRLAFADAHAHVADPEHMRTSAAALLDPGYLASRARLVDPTRAGRHASGEPPRGGTVYLCAADAQGRMVSMIQSNFKGFGSGVVVPDTGISLQNRGSGFSLVPGHPNEVAPGKRPYHTIIPAFMTRQGRPVMAFGVMGGNMQPQGHLQVAMRFIDERLDPQACSDAPRWRIDDAGSLTVEAATSAQTVRELEAMGHAVRVMPHDSLDFGSAQAIARLSDRLEDGYVGGSDHRRDGQAVGF